MDDLDRKGPPFAFDHRRAAHQAREKRAVERRRHGQQAQIRAQRRLRVERQRQAEIAVEAALMDLVEQHRGDAGQLRIGLDAPQEDALGEDGDPRARRALAVEPGRVADRAADGLAGQRRHPLGGGAGGEAAGGEQQDFAAAPGLAEQGWGHAGGLAGAGRRDEDGARADPQRGEQVRQDGVDGQGGHQRRLSVSLANGQGRIIVARHTSRGGNGCRRRMSP